MNPKEYSESVVTVENKDFNTLAERFKLTRSIRLLHGCIGLASEVSEVQALAESQEIDVTNLKEEMGDIQWYQNLFITELGFDPNEIYMFNDTDKLHSASANEAKALLQEEVHGITKEVGELIDLVKKHLMYGRELNVAGVKDRLQKIDYHTNRALRSHALTSAQARERNDSKLVKVRYKDGYSDKAATERNTTEERTDLEKT